MLVKVSLLEMAKLGLQVLEVLCDTLVLLCQPDVGLSVLLLMLCIFLLQSSSTSVKALVRLCILWKRTRHVTSAACVSQGIRVTLIAPLL